MKASTAGLGTGTGVGPHEVANLVVLQGGPVSQKSPEAARTVALEVPKEPGASVKLLQAAAAVRSMSEALGA